MNPISVSKLCLYCGLPGTKSYCCPACEALDQVGIAKDAVEATHIDFSYLDNPSYKSLHEIKGQNYNFLFYADGMSCSSCVHLLERLPLYYQGIVSAVVNFGNSTVAVRLLPEASLARVAGVIQELGYKPALIGPDESTETKYLKDNRESLKRIAVAGFCAGNMMLFTIPVYAGLDGTLKEVFNVISFMLFLPILFYSAKPFYVGAWTSLKYHHLSIDLPIVVAMLAGFLMSTFNLIRQNGNIYFDSTASFLFLILSARFLLKRVQQNFLSTATIKNGLKHEFYLRKVATGESLSDVNETVPFSAVKAGDLLTILKNQIIPCDGILVSASASLDTALLNGESLPRTFVRGMTLEGGTKNLQDEIRICISCSFEQSKVGQLFQKLELGANVKNDFGLRADRLAQKLVLVVFSIAALFFAAYSIVDVSEAFRRSLALLVVACPCALAFGAPLTYGFALKKALSVGILIKNASVFERVLTMKNIFFDKTGTLTEGALQLSHTEPSIISVHDQNVILKLESRSYHPVAFALRSQWAESLTCDVGPLNDFEEVLGYGVKGKLYDANYELRTLAESTHDCQLAVELTKNGSPVCRLYFLDKLRTESAQVVRELHAEGFHCSILTGDTMDRALIIGHQCGIPASQIHAGLYPEDKKAILARSRDTCMLGDGANDSLSLQYADLGIAVKGSADLSLQFADVYFTRGGLTPFLELRRLAKKTQIVLERNLSISLIYNVVAGGLALSGMISPMTAAILMPLSSAAVIFSSIWGFR
ncbi:MAG: heavy metal translocating P-type ATPase [Bdellovibrionaceae bacterium]|nr:heavy metal translocating P-type ATPase [Pseudobdellovibrionaceae bacterium]